MFSRITLKICALRVLLYSAALSSAQQTYGDNYLETIKDSDVVASAFPEVEGIELLAPAFTKLETLPEGWSNGTEGPTELFELDYFIRSIANRNSWISYKSADFLSEEGRFIPYLFLSKTPNYCGNSTKLKVYIQAAIHGNEPAADQGALALLGKLDANQTYTASLLDKLDILILPRYNVDGVSYFQRVLASNLDPNREHLKLDRQQSRDIKQVFSDYNPHLAIDLHEFTAPTVYGGDYQHGNDALIAGGIHPNTRASIRDYLNNVLTPFIGDRLESYCLRWGPYVIGTSNRTSGSKIVWDGPSTQPRSGRNAMGLTQTIAFLFEMRGIRLADQHFQRRVATTLIKLEALLEYARDNTEEVRSIVEDARADFIGSNDDVVVTDSPRANLTQQTFTFVDRRNGSVVKLPVDFYETRPAVANLTRSRPEAYLIPRTWFDVVVRLKILGLEVQTLDYEYNGIVEALNITSSSLSDSIYEGHVLNTVTTEPISKEVRLPAGSFLVSTRQQNAALAFIALEPESIDSYVTFNLIPLGVADEYPVYRVLAE
ncbi:putative peptidase M14, carboxypeptidase A [Septoria linicola]|nr:putative peptidase M14, carboxypeptidase A [Septoria linicola]